MLVVVKSVTSSVVASESGVFVHGQYILSTIDERVFFAQIADQKVSTTRWDTMYRIERRKHDCQNQIHDQMELIDDAADACELHWTANKYKEPRPFYHLFAKVHHPTSTESAQQSSTSTLLSTTPYGLLPQTVTMPSTIKKRKNNTPSSPDTPAPKPPVLVLPNEKKLHYGNMVQHQTNTNPMTTPISQLPDTM